MRLPIILASVEPVNDAAMSCDAVMSRSNISVRRLSGTDAFASDYCAGLSFYLDF